MCEIATKSWVHEILAISRLRTLETENIRMLPPIPPALVFGPWENLAHCSGSSMSMEEEFAYVSESSWRLRAKLSI